MIRFLLLAAFLFTINFTHGQNTLVSTFSNENTELLKQLKNREQLRKSRVTSYMQSNPKRSATLGDSLNKRHIYDVVDGVVLYRSTHNLSSARATKTTAIQTGGSLGLSLDGTDITVGVWDFGPIDTTHPEFQTKANIKSRATNVDSTSVSDETEYDDHATHVSGTIGAKGVNVNVKGMAPNINIHSYNWDDDFKEMLSAASAPVNPMILSNHSYGVTIVGDDDEQLPAWYMGAYTEDAQFIDQISRNNRKYLMVTSAGNDGSLAYDGGLYPGYDKLTIDKNAKNNLVIANADPILSGFPYNLNSLYINKGSSQGPTDDLRIKPDLAADGTNVYSTIRNGLYGMMSGTSMSAPNATGTLALLQQYYMQLHGEYMNSSTLKGLVCHTSIDNIGEPGPDPSFGWGFLDAKASAETILNATKSTAILSELNLAQNETYSTTFSAQAGDKLKATICWTDMPGDISQAVLNDPTPRLVNDLDLRLSKDGETFYPWRLDYSASSGFSNSKGDNNVDNIEIVEIDAPSSGIYTLTVSHKGTLKGKVGTPFDPQSQDFSLIVTGQNVVLGTKTSMMDNSLLMFPNPSNGEFAISFDSRSNMHTNNIVNVSIYDMSGRLVYKNTFTHTSDRFYETIKLLNAKPGVYIANISKDQSITTHKIVIE